MDIDMDGKFHTHGKPVKQLHYERQTLKQNGAHAVVKVHLSGVYTIIHVRRTCMIV